MACTVDVAKEHFRLSLQLQGQLIATADLSTGACHLSAAPWVRGSYPTVPLSMAFCHKWFELHECQPQCDRPMCWDKHGVLIANAFQLGFQNLKRHAAASV